ncbi:LTA synthase family protein [Bacillus marasmi]|uniref:LTA synthase family protein n=1 Tax=Bacillus marasmi TaxID=1926279 RepID=UPI0011C9D715|nr:LTA synthase family protein [Bacillus marasmi]
MSNSKNSLKNIFHMLQKWPFTFLIIFLMGLCLGLISMYFGAAHYIMPMFLSYFKIQYLPFLNIFPVISLIFLLYFIFNRVWVSFLLTSIITLGFTWINYFKLMIRNDPLLVADLRLFSEAQDMMGKYEINSDWKINSVIVACVLGTIIGKYLFKGKIKKLKSRLIGIIIVLLICAISYKYVYSNSKVYSETENLGIINQWSSTQVYISKGFVYPFIYSIQTSFEKKPEGYNEKETKKRLSAYDYSDIAMDKKVNVISIMLEAYNDFTKFDQVEINETVYEYFHQLQSESVSGELITNIFAGGTVDTERSFLTGFARTDTSYRSNVNSYVRYFKEQGYTVEGSHPCYDWFYNRKNVNEFLGFENYYFFENYYSELANGEIANDNIVFPQIIKLFEKNKKTGKPYFSFNVTYQNHGPYPHGGTYEEKFVLNEGLTTEEFNIFNNYLAGIRSTNEELKKLVDHFRNEEEPVVIILFGDHNPWLADNNTIYEKLGIDLDTSNEEGFYNYYNTPYLIWGNDSANQVLNNDLNDKGPTIGPHFLMNVFFDYAGYEGNEFMKQANEVRSVVDAIHSSGRYVQSKELTEKLPSDSQKKVNEFLHSQYYWKNHFKK